MPGAGTPRRTIRIPDPVWAAARARAEEEKAVSGEDLSTMLARVVREYACGATVVRLGPVDGGGV